MKNNNEKLSRFVPLTDNELTPLETLFSAEWVHGIELGFDNVRYDEPSEEILWSKEALSSFLIEEGSTLYHAPKRSLSQKEASASSASPSNGVMTEKEVAEYFGVSSWTVRGWRVKGDLPFIRLEAPSRRVFYRLETVKEWLSQREAKSVTKPQESETQFVSVV